MAVAQLWQWQFADVDARPRKLDKVQVEFSAIEGWANDDHAAAFAVFRKPCMLSKSKKAAPKTSSGMRAVCELARLLDEKLSRKDARRFFEANFTPYLVKRPEKGALLTGYYEPEIKGSLTPSEKYSIPIYAKPDDLVLAKTLSDRGSLPTELTAARLTPEGPKPYYTRKEIELGALKGRGLEIVYVSNAFEAFMMQIQGSGLIRLPNGKTFRIGFAAKNGHPYSSIAQVLIDRGVITKEKASAQALGAWIRANPKQGRELMWENKSYPFFEKLDVDAPRGSMTLPLVPGRSLAVDPRYHQLGMPIWVSAPTLTDARGKKVERLMVAHDTGSAIRGPVRGDFFWGSGAKAGKFAGRTKHLCDFYVFVPK
jgi:membrane-bound lytic murein transglycosylase A